MRRYQIAAEAGFTLLEMVVSVTLVALMAVGLWGAFRISLASWSRGTQSIDENQRSRTILDLVRKQMASTYGLTAPADPQQPGVIYPIFEGAERRLRFISLNSLRFHDSPGLTTVVYDVIPDDTGNYSLIEREERYLGINEDQSIIVDREEVGITTVFENLSSFVFEYFDPGDNANPARWVGEWDSKTLRRLPVAISMTMIARNSKGDPLSRHVVVPIQAKPGDLRVNPVSVFNPPMSSMAGQ
jgi:prepilin-type N-terminal cleavage/methylation domain-containing protein